MKTGRETFFILHEPMPIYVTMGGADWKIFVENCGHLDRCYLMRRGMKRSELMRLATVGSGYMDHLFRVLGVEIRCDKPEFGIFYELCRVGRATQLPEARSSIDHPFPKRPQE